MTTRRGTQSIRTSNSKRSISPSPSASSTADVTQQTPPLATTAIPSPSATALKSAPPPLSLAKQPLAQRRSSRHDLTTILSSAFCSPASMTTAMGPHQHDEMEKEMELLEQENTPPETISLGRDVDYEPQNLASLDPHLLGSLVAPRDLLLLSHDGSPPDDCDDDNDDNESKADRKIPTYPALKKKKNKKTKREQGKVADHARPRAALERSCSDFYGDGDGDHDDVSERRRWRWSLDV